MTSAVLSDHDARQWLRLRRLRVERARQALGQAQQDERRAKAVVHDREAQIDLGRTRLHDLARHWGGAGSADLPRWAGQLKLHREALAERLERDEYALIDEQASLQQAEAVVRERHAELTRAQAREAAVDATLKDQRCQDRQTREQRAELEAEDATRASR